VSIQRKVTPKGKLRYRARIKANGRDVASRMFDRKSDAVAWEQDQRRRLRAGEWLDPRRGQVPLSTVAVTGVAAHREASDVGKRSRGVAELHRSEVRASASGIDHYGRRLELARRSDETWPCSVDGDASAGHPPISPVVCCGGRPSDGECCRGGASSDRGAGAARGQVP
jgi:hypothetical protein